MARVELATAWDPKELMEGYSAMARDVARERQAQEWSEALIADSSPIERRAISPAPSPQPRNLL